MVKPSPAHALPSYDDKNSGHWPIPSCSVGTVGADMPGVNGICNLKMSLSGSVFELLLRHDAALRNFHNFAQKGTVVARWWASEGGRKWRYPGGVCGRDGSRSMGE
ncbi:hypothetical protein [Tabrizicola aquatica]|uniref:hypothetical protein n=1 Tax=Tabrizicola aquatica TaxID=909926 RepID=UPI0011AF91D2|nr:hypothetical protein [Tabrizicola aquatica]